MNAPNYYQVRSAVFRPTIGFDGRCDCWDCTKPTRWQKLIAAIVRVLVGG